MSTARLAPAARSFLRPIHRPQEALAHRLTFSSSPHARDLVGKAQEVADTVSKKVGKAASKGIENLETAANKAKSAAQGTGTQAKHVARDAQNEFGKTKDSAKSLAQDAYSKVKN